MARPEDRLSLMTTRLEQVTKESNNSTAEEYMRSLSDYLQGLTLDGRRLEQNPTNQQGNDTSTGILWIVVLPISFFLVVFLILGCILAFIWYYQSISNGVEASRVSSSNSRMSSGPSLKKNGTFTARSTRSMYSNEFQGIQNRDASKETINPMSKKSVLTCASCESNAAASRSLNVRKNLFATIDYHLDSACTPPNHQHFFETSNSKCLIFSGHHFQNTSYLDYHEYHSTPNKATMSVSSNKSFSISTESDDDAFSRDNLRASMESHKLVRMGNSKIRPDDTYSWSGNNNNANTTARVSDNADRRSLGSGLSLRGYQNPVFQDEFQTRSVDRLSGGNFDRYYETPTGFSKTETQKNMVWSKSKLSPGLNISSVSQTQINSNSSSKSGPVRRYNMKPLVASYGTCTKDINSSMRNTARLKDDRRNQTQTPRLASKCSDSLPPLPSNQYHRRDIATNSATKKKDETSLNRSEHEQTSACLSHFTISDFDKSSLVESSRASGTSSQSYYSIERFQITKHPPSPVTPMLVVRNDCRRSGLNMSLPLDSPSSRKLNFNQSANDLSICQNIGSFNQSIEGSIPLAKFLEGSFCDGDESRSRNGNANASTRNNSGVKGDVGTKTSQFEIHLKNMDEQNNQNCQMESSPKIYKEGDAKLKRLLSLDQLRASQATVEQRLRQFGYTRNKIHHNIFSEMKLEKEERSSSDKMLCNSLILTTASEERLKDDTKNSFEIKNSSFTKPEIVQIAKEETKVVNF